MLSTERLSLRPLQENDIELIASLLGDPIAMRYVGSGRPIDRSAAAAWLRRSRTSFRTDGTGALAVVLKSNGLVIGYCGVDVGEDTGELELTYALLPAYWGKGLALEAAAAVVAYADGFLEILLATADPSNSASVRILESLGFEQTRIAADLHGLPTAFFRRHRPVPSQGAC